MTVTAVAGPTRPRELLSSPGAPIGLGGTAVNETIRLLAARKAKVFVATLSEDCWGRWTGAHGSVTVSVGHYRSRHRSRDFFKAERDQVEKLLGESNAQVVYANWTYEYALGALSSGIPTLVAIRDDPLAVWRHQPTMYRAVRALMAANVARKATHFCAPSQAAANRFFRIMPGNSAIPIIPNPVSGDIWQQRSTHVPIGQSSVLAVASADRLKNIGALLEAWPRVLASFPEAQLRVAGPGLENASPLARRYASQRIHFLGELSRHQVIQELQVCDVFIHPSRSESFGNIVAEALTIGAPTMVYRGSGGAAEIVGHGPGIFDDCSSRGVAAALVNVLGDSGLRRSLAEEGNDRVLQIVDPSRVTRLLLDVLNGISSGG